MAHLVKKIAAHALRFICDQYLIVFFICTIGLKLAGFNTFVTKVTWPSDQYWCGIIIGLFSVAIIFSPLYFVHKHKNKIAIILALLASILLTIDTIYYSYFSSLPTIGLFGSIGQVGGVSSAIIGLLHWQLILYFIDIILVLIFYKPIKAFFTRTKVKHDLQNQGRVAAIINTLITIIIFWVAFQPMGLARYNDFINKGYNTVSATQCYGVIMGHLIDLIRFIEVETTHLSKAQETSLSGWVSTNKSSQTTDDLTGIAKGKNVIMIQVESLGGFALNQEVNGKELTPNLDALASTSQFFPNNRFVIGAGHTSDADFVANTSYFPLNDAAVFVRYGQDDFTSLPKTLEANGYSAYAYHGYNRNFWNRNVALSSLGYQKFYASDNYSDGKKINLGLNDGDFLLETADYIKDQPKPSLSYAITLSSHVPFDITDDTKNLGINTADYPEQVGGYLENINYVDRMLGKFFDKLKAEGLYDDSLIIVYGDHVPVLSAFKAGTISYDPDTVQGKEVPLIIKLPQETTGKTYENKSTSLDITPTVLDLLGIKTNQLMFGQSLFADNSQTGTLKVCSDQLVAFSGFSNCSDALTEEKNKSAEIIRYNQFNNL